MLTLALYLILLARARPGLIQYASLPLAFSYIARPTNSIAVLVLTVFVFVQYRRYFVRYILWALIVAVPFVLYNLSIYQAPLSNYYRSFRGLTLSSRFLEALPGTLISPSRGLLIFSPILIFALAGLVLKIRQHQFERLDAFLLGIVLLHWLLISSWPIWWAGWSFGPRMFADILPFLMYWMIYAVVALTRLTGSRRYAWLGLGSVLLVWSLFVNYRGANAAETQVPWNVFPGDIDRHPERVWDLRDIQFLRGFTWGIPVDISAAGVDPRQMGPDIYLSMGTNDVHVRLFDAAHSFIAPPGRSYVAISANESIAPQLLPLFDAAQPSILHQTIGNPHFYRLYSFDAGAQIFKFAAGATHAAFASPAVFPDRSSLSPVMLPVKFGESAELLGYQLLRDVNSAGRWTLITYWRAGENIVTPLQMFVHAIGSKGAVVAQNDRLDASPYDWRSGDLIAQVHKIKVPPQATSAWLEIGLYNADSGERLPVTVNGHSLGDRVLLQELQP